MVDLWSIWAIPKFTFSNAYDWFPINCIYGFTRHKFAGTFHKRSSCLLHYRRSYIHHYWRNGCDAKDYEIHTSRDNHGDACRCLIPVWCPNLYLIHRRTMARIHNGSCFFRCTKTQCKNTRSSSVYRWHCPDSCFRQAPI